MYSIFKPYLNQAEVNASPWFKKLKEKGLNYMSTFNFDEHKKRTYESLRILLESEMPKDYFVMLITPWMNTLQFMGIVDKVSAFEEKQQYINDILKHSEQLRNAMKYWINNSQTIGLFTFMEGFEPNLENLIFNLEELEQIANFCSKHLEFARGKKYSQSKIRRYGVFALFHLGESLGLPNDKKPSKLYRFVNIISDLDEKCICDYYTEYENTTLEKEINSNPIFEYIYSPRAIRNTI